jgi:hypothetical protein
VAGLERGGHAPRWSANGKELYDVEMDGRLVVALTSVRENAMNVRPVVRHWFEELKARV